MLPGLNLRVTIFAVKCDPSLGSVIDAWAQVTGIGTLLCMGASPLLEHKEMSQVESYLGGVAPVCKPN